MKTEADRSTEYILLLAQEAIRAKASNPSLLNAASIHLETAVRVLAEKAAEYDQLNTPEIKDFLMAVEREALHQRDIHAHKGDAGKSDADWFWLLGYLGGKAMHAGGAEKSAAAVGSPMARQYYEKQLHHIITTAAACLNWHAARVGTYQDMRPGIAAPGEPS